LRGRWLGVLDGAVIFGKLGFDGSKNLDAYGFGDSSGELGIFKREGVVDFFSEVVVMDNAQKDESDELSDHLDAVFVCNVVVAADRGDDIGSCRIVYGCAQFVRRRFEAVRNDIEGDKRRVNHGFLWLMVRRPAAWR
jgi:hypothetical protein